MFGPLIAALDRNTAALNRLTSEEMHMDQDIQAAIAVAQAVADTESALHTDLAALIAAIGGAPSLSADDRAALQNAVARLQGSVSSLQADAAEAVGATGGAPASASASTSGTGIPGAPTP